MNQVIVWTDKHADREGHTHTNANEIELKKHEAHHCHDSQMEHELRIYIVAYDF